MDCAFIVSEELYISLAQLKSIVQWSMTTGREHGCRVSKRMRVADPSVNRIDVSGKRAEEDSSERVTS